MSTYCAPLVWPVCARCGTSRPPSTLVEVPLTENENVLTCSDMAWCGWMVIEAVRRQIPEAVTNGNPKD